MLDGQRHRGILEPPAKPRGDAVERGFHLHLELLLRDGQQRGHLSAKQGAHPPRRKPSRPLEAALERLAASPAQIGGEASHEESEE